MKKQFFATLFSCIAFCGISAQNIQLHYDLGRSLYSELNTRPELTTTVEMFKPDPWGSTFFFVDMDYSAGKVASAYWEIARELKFWKAPFSLHVEYNGGINYVPNSYLGGLTYTWNNKNFSKGFSLTGMYKYIHHNPQPHNFQLTGTWYIHFLQGKCSFTGFVDFWREKHADINGNNHNFVFMTEPQFWVNLNKFKHVNEKFNLSIGTEWEITNNFAVLDGFYVIPTLAMKWSF